MAAGIGSVVSLYMDTPRKLEVGNAIQTGSGRLYEITALRRQERGKHTGRWHIGALVVDPALADTYDRIIPLAWYPR